MAGFIDMLGKKPETESGSSYQRTVLREVARKLNDLEEQNEQNALAIEEVRKLQRTVLQRLDAMKMDKEDGIGGRPGAGDISARTEGINDLQKQIRMLTQQLSSGVDHLGTEIGDIVRKLADLDGQIQQVQAQQAQQVQVQQEQLQQMQAQVQEEERPAEDGESLKDQLDTLRLSLEDTVHKENIKCFRNIQGALEEQGDGRSYDLNAQISEGDRMVPADHHCADRAADSGTFIGVFENFEKIKTSVEKCLKCRSIRLHLTLLEIHHISSRRFYFVL